MTSSTIGARFGRHESAGSCTGMRTPVWQLLQLLLAISLTTNCCWGTADAWTSADVCGTDVAWTYEPVSGKCWFLPSEVTAANSTQLVSRLSAAQQCAGIAAAGGGGGELLLPAPVTAADMTGMQRFLTAQGLAADVWTGIVRLTVENGTSNFFYPDGNTTVPLDYWLDGEVPSSNSYECAVYTSRVEPVGDGSWTRLMGLKPRPCSSGQAALCYKNVTQCQASNASDLNLSTMTAVNASYGVQLVNRLHIGLRQDVQCSEGFFRARDSPVSGLAIPPTTSDGLGVNQVECFPGGGPGSPPVLKSATIEPCQMASCPTAPLKTDFRIPNVQPYDEALLTLAYFMFGESLNVNCTPGYVSYVNQTSVRSQLSCGYSFKDHTQPEWVPPDFNTCQPVSCPPIQTVISSFMTAYKAFDRLNEKEYNEFQRSSFPYYPNRVYIKCLEIGTFFDDRSFTKVVACELQNGSLTEGSWYGALGTSLSRLSTTQCVPVSCLSDQLIAKTPTGDAFLSGLNYANFTTVEFLNGSQISMATDTFNALEFYNYGTIVRFSCAAGSSTGVGAPVVLCTDTGNWNVSRLPTCTKTSEVVVPKGKHYVPPSVEAQGADSIGAIAIIVCVIFGVFIVILDLSTLSRDLVLIRRNIRRLKRRVTPPAEAAQAQTIVNSV